MAMIKPFPALRYNFQKAGAPETICCPPYDIIPSPDTWLSSSKYNAIRLEGGVRLGTENPYADAKNTLASWLNDGILYKDDAPAFYIYHADFTALDGTKQTLRGIAALLKLYDFSEGEVLPHEFTLSKDRADRERLMTETKCQFSPIYGLYNDPAGEVRKLTAKLEAAPAEISFAMPDGVTHSLRTLNSPDTCEKITALFADKKIYIADGHHRYETLLHLKKTCGGPEHVMIFLADMNGGGIDIWPTHRIVSNLPNYDEAAVRKSLEANYNLSSADGDPKDGTFSWVTNSGEYLLTPKAPWTEKSSAAALHNNILEPIFAIDQANMAAGKNLTYTREAAEARELVRSGKAQCAFLTPPPKMSELRETVLSGEKMPQKSTYFFPKIITGLFMRDFS